MMGEISSLDWAREEANHWVLRVENTAGLVVLTVLFTYNGWELCILNVPWVWMYTAAMTPSWPWDISDTSQGCLVLLCISFDLAVHVLRTLNRSSIHLTNADVHNSMLWVIDPMLSRTHSCSITEALIYSQRNSHCPFPHGLWHLYYFLCENQYRRSHFRSICTICLTMTSLTL